MVHQTREVLVWGLWTGERVLRTGRRYAAAMAVTTASVEERRIEHVSTRLAPGWDSLPRLLPDVFVVVGERVTS